MDPGPPALECKECCAEEDEAMVACIYAQVHKERSGACGGEERDRVIIVCLSLFLLLMIILILKLYKFSDAKIRLR